MATELTSNSDLYAQWRDRWDDFLTDIEQARDADEIERKLRDKVTIGNAERRIAGGHEGREILELLQNARDAIQQGEGEGGQVYIGVYDEGVMVANTGSRFDFFDPEVEKAVTMIGETGKGDGDGQSIGHKGVGLKSILATGDSFEIYTRPDETLDEILGVKLSRKYLLGALLSRLDVDISLKQLVNDVEDPALEALISEHSETANVSLDSDIRDALSKLPLFNFPVPVDVDNSTDDVVKRAKRLLQNSSESKRFRTVVFVRYADDQWRDLLSQSGIPLPDEGDRSLEDRPDRIWNYLAQSSSEEGLRKETLVQLGGIDSLQLERNFDSGVTPATVEEWDITRSGDTSPSDDALYHETVEVAVDSENISHREVFDQFRFREETDHDVSLLVGKKTTTAPDQYPREYPLYLYYPIQNTATTSFPFCLHGRFRVETNRKDLSNNNIEENQSVLKEGLELIEKVSVETARDSTETGSYGDSYPWTLLPPVPEIVSEDPTTQSELLRWFCNRLYERLRENPNIALDEGKDPVPAASTLLHWNNRTLASYRSLRTVETSVEANGETDHRPLPAEHVLAAYQSFPTRWVQRLKELLLAEMGASEYTDEVVRDWAITLSNRLTNFDEPTLRVEAAAGRNLLYGLVDLIFDCTDGDDDIETLLSDLSGSLEGTYLLPCGISGSDSDDGMLQLVPIERRQSPQGERARGVQSRSVIWDLKSAGRTTTTPPAPARGTSFTVYFFDDEVEQDESVHKLLSLAGRLWGIRAYEGIPSFVRSLLDAFAFGSKEVLQPRDFAFLTAITQDLGQESTDLQFGEGAYLPLDYLNSAIQQSKGDQRRNLERRIRLRNCSVQLPDETAPFQIRTTALDDSWQARLLRDDTADEEGEDSPTLESLTYPADMWPAPAAGSWTTILDAINREVSEVDIARTLSLLGASAFPNLSVVWMYGNDHPDMRQSTAWNPDVWPEQEFDGAVPATVQDLVQILDELNGDYRDWITSPGYHPQETAGHSSKCDVKLDGTVDETNLGAWVWCEDIATLENQGEDVITLLQRHGDSIITSLLQTGWSCNNGHIRRDWTDTVPTLFNWQLRQLDAWGSVLSIHEDVSEQWSEESRTLEFAVQESSSQGAQAARLFPTIDPEADDTPGEDLLSALGVESVDGLNSTQAARHLQKLQEVLAVDSLETGPVKLNIPPGRENDWSQAYTKLLKPLMRRLPQDDPRAAQFADGGFLTHFPLLDGDAWVSVPIDEFREIASKQIRYYGDQSPKPWEKHEVAENEDISYVLQHTSEGPFVRLATHLGVEQVDASKPVIDWEDANGRLVDDDELLDHVDSLRHQLLERRDLLVASTEREQEEEIRKTADSLRSAVENLTIIEAFPDAIEAQLSDLASGLYRTADGQIGLAFNLDACDTPPRLQALAMGLALLVERPTNIATFREALQQDVAISELETRWERLTFPIEIVQRILGSEVTKELHQRFAALDSLFVRLDISIEMNTDEALADLAEADSGITEATKRWLATGDSPSEALADHDEVRELGEKLRARLPESYHFVLQQLFFPSDTRSWQSVLPETSLSTEEQRTVIRWLLSSSSNLPMRPLNPTVRAGWVRLFTVVEVWNNTGLTNLTEIETWRRGSMRFEDSVTIDWTGSPPSIVTSDSEPTVLFYLATDEKLRNASSTFVNHVGSEIPENAENIQDALLQYIHQDEFPEVAATETGARQHQEEAFAELQEQLTDTEGELELPGGGNDGWDVDQNVSAGNLSVSEGSDSSSGGSRQYTGRGQQAEVYTIASVLDRLSAWLEYSPGGVMLQFKSRFKRLHKEQQSTDYKWHVENAWRSGLLETLDDSARDDSALLDEESLKKWRTDISDKILSSRPIVKLLNVTQEQGPGFDIIDPFGPLDTDLQTGLDALQFSPVEIKAVGGTEPPFHFRFTTNEYRRCKAFVSESDHRYIIRLVDVPESGTPNWPAQTTFVTEKVLETSKEVDQLMEIERFDKVVKGGYMNMSLE